ncbi:MULTISPECIES: hypothetical protein [Halolamina]|uniref:Predicted nucleic acid-binding protein, contains PIN domain n=1 Tax=Halolamina pelagica TaxID=699431 RepID=A0A1I5VUY4_9EURY|nr:MULTISPECIES: hypothetical protein [Halolamina]NHX37870.1 hypothetical protein [Halolamina sp. R1-12]SFQ11309.1 Predicted nucleic acid-binding protein, contains PIN domain [Halolamina pelagica]
MSESPRPVYLDSTVLSNLALTDSVDVLFECFQDPVVPEPVADELADGAFDDHPHLNRAILQLEPDNAEIVQSQYDEPNLSQDWLRRESVAVPDYPDEIRTVDPGEAAVLILAHEHGGVAATDDGDARDVANSLGIDCTGSLGVLAKAVHTDVIDVETADQWLAEWIDYGYYSPVESVSELL